MNFIHLIASTINSIGSFVAYCHRDSNNIWEKYDDFQNKIKVARPSAEA